MELTYDEISVRGKRVNVPAIDINGQRYVVTGKFLKVVRLKEEWYEDVEDPESIIKQLKEARIGADLFTFWQRLPETEPEYDYFMEWEAIAAIPLKGYEYWFEKQINKGARKAIRRSAKRGIVVKETVFDDEFVKGMTEIFNETPIRQGKPFWHYGKDFNTIKHEFSRFLFREKLIGAYHDNELVGFIFMTDQGKFMKLGQIISKLSYRDKSPNNALLARVVEICERKRCPYLTYGLWHEGTFGDFKKHNGFEKFNLPRYYIPLTLKGKIILSLLLHHGITGIFPKVLKNYLKSLREKWYSVRTRRICYPK